MRYSKAQLLAVANEIARELGSPPVSESVLESWISPQKFFAAAKPRGVKRGVNPEWTYPESALETIRLILLLKSLGANRTTQLVICLWVFGASFPYPKIARALRSELYRIIARQERGPPWFEDHYSDLPKLSDAERAKRIAQLPKLDPDLAATGIAPTPEVFLSVALRAYWGTEGNNTGLVSVLFPFAETPSSPADIIGLLFGIDGAIGPPEQSANGGYEIFDRIAPDDLDSARSLFFLCFASLALMAFLLGLLPGLKDSKLGVAYRKATVSFLHPEWIVPTIALFAISAFNFQTAATK